MTYDHWKTTNPADEWLGPEPEDEPSGRDEMIRWEPDGHFGTRWIVNICDVDCVYGSQEEAIEAEQEYIRYLIQENRRLKKQLGAMK